MVDEDADRSGDHTADDARTARADAEPGASADVEAGRDAGSDRRAEEIRRARARERAQDEERAGFDFSLPPISLPEVRFPERIRLVLSAPSAPETTHRPIRVRASWVLLAVVLVDALDALAVVLAGPTTLPWVRAAVGLLLAVVVAGLPGLLYAWELLAILGGVGVLSVAPTLTALVLLRLLRST